MAQDSKTINCNERWEILRNKHNHIVIRHPSNERNGEALGFHWGTLSEARHAQLVGGMALGQGQIQMLCKEIKGRVEGKMKSRVS